MWNAGTPALARPGALVQAAVRGDSLDQLLELGARTLLATGNADRAGLWLAGRRGETARGLVVESTPAPIPEEWKRLDVSTPFLRATMESLEPLDVELDGDPLIPHLGALVGMRRTIWIPIRARHSTLGLAMVSYLRTGIRAETAALRACAEEIALFVAQERDARRRDLAADERQSQLRISRAVLRGVSVDSILPQIARAARHYAQAEFVVVGRASVSPSLGEGWDGSKHWRTMMQQQVFTQMWREVLEEGHQSEIDGEVMTSWSDSQSDGPVAALERVVALPIEVRNGVCGVLMAGVLPSDEASEDLVRLESYALLAATALDLELARGEKAAYSKSLQQTVEKSLDVLVTIDESGLVHESSRGAAALLFSDSEPAEGMRLEELFVPEHRNAIARWREGLAQRHLNVPVTTAISAPPLESTLRGGSLIRLQVRSAIPGRRNDDQMWILHLEDRGPRQEITKEEDRLRAEMSGLLDSIDSGVLVLDGMGSIRFASDRLAAILGLERRSLLELDTVEALIDRVAYRLARPAETATSWRERLHRGDEASWDEFELTRPSRKVVERFARPLLNSDGTRLGWLEIYRDITGQRVIQSKLLQTEKMAALGQLVSGIAHELNNPLTSIRGYAQLLLTRHSTAQRTADARRISQEAERAGRIVKNLLLFSREAKPERGPVDLNEVIERTLALRTYELKLENISMELALETGLPHTLADASQLQQVVLNLIVNAEQAIAQARVHGHSSRRRGHILIRTRRLPGDRIAMEISDDGPGITPEIASRIFDPFFTTKSAGVGTGLGLSIVYGIMQGHGGEVSVESHPGRGATLTIELPVLCTADLEMDPPSGTLPQAVTAAIPVTFVGKPALQPVQILVVEDEPTVAQLIADVLSEQGSEVDTLLDSREALERAREKKYDLIICDLKMPHLDGSDFYRALVREGNGAEQRILFVTGDTMGHRTLDFLKSTGAPFLAKPFLVEELKEIVHRAIASPPASEEIAVEPEWLRIVAREK